MKIIVTILLLHITVYCQQWVKLDGPAGGTISGIIAKGDTIVAGTFSSYKAGVIFYSFNKGNTWKEAKQRFNDRVMDFCFTSDGGIIAATLTDNGSTPIASSKGVYKSYDFENWVKVLPNENFICLGKDSNNNIYAGTTSGKVFISSNSGNTWRNIFVSPGNLKFILMKSGTLFLACMSSIYKKRPTDTTFSFVSGNYGQGGLYYIFLCKDEKENLYYQLNDRTYKTSNEGLTWSVNRDSVFYYGNNNMDSFDFIHTGNKLILPCADGKLSWGSGWGTAISEDDGASWRWDSTGLGVRFAYCLKLAKSGEDTYLGTDAAGVFRSTDYGESWFPINNGLNAVNSYDVVFDSAGNMYSCDYNCGIHKSTDRGRTWELKNNGLDNAYVLSLVIDKKNVLITSTIFGVFVSTDLGESWNRSTRIEFFSLYMDSKDRMYGTNVFGLYRSTDYGNTWTKLDNNFSESWVSAFAEDEIGNLYAGIPRGGIYKSSDDGLTWFQCYLSSNVNSFIENIKVSKNGFIYAANETEGILISKDRGSSWKRILSDNGPRILFPIAVDTAGVIYTTTYYRRFIRSPNGGDNWEDITGNLFLADINNILFDKKGKMYLCTIESIWTTPDSIVSVREKNIPQIFTLNQNYPNPFNPSTTIEYSIVHEGIVTLKLFNLLGQEIKTLVNQSQKAGRYSVLLDGALLPTGIYFYQIRSGNYTETKKMILLR